MFSDTLYETGDSRSGKEMYRTACCPFRVDPFLLDDHTCLFVREPVGEAFLQRTRVVLSNEHGV